jgi:hypothetical protein
MEDLGQRGFHARALAGRKDDDVQIGHEGGRGPETARPMIIDPGEPAAGLARQIVQKSARR